MEVSLKADVRDSDVRSGGLSENGELPVTVPDTCKQEKDLFQIAKKPKERPFAVRINRLQL